MGLGGLGGWAFDAGRGGSGVKIFFGTSRGRVVINYHDVTYYYNRKCFPCIALSMGHMMTWMLLFMVTMLSTWILKLSVTVNASWHIGK